MRKILGGAVGIEQKITTRIEYLFDRWCDEQKYEDFDTYKESLRGLIEAENLELVKAYANRRMELMELMSIGIPCVAMKAVIHDGDNKHTITCDENEISHTTKQQKEEK